MIDDCDVVCENCKHVRIAGGTDYSICSKRVSVYTAPEGVTEKRYRVTWKALEEFRAENNGKCPHFKKKFRISDLFN